MIHRLLDARSLLLSMIVCLAIFTGLSSSCYVNNRWVTGASIEELMITDPGGRAPRIAIQDKAFQANYGRSLRPALSRACECDVAVISADASSAGYDLVIEQPRLRYLIIEQRGLPALLTLITFGIVPTAARKSTMVEFILKRDGNEPVFVRIEERERSWLGWTAFAYYAATADRTEYETVVEISTYYDDLSENYIRERERERHVASFLGGVASGRIDWPAGVQERQAKEEEEESND